MAKAIVTPTDLRDFATILQKNIEEFTLIENSMNQKLNSYDWKDAVALKFKADFEATKEPLNKLRQQMEEFIPHLIEKAGPLEEGYLRNGGVNLGTFMAGMAVAGVVGTSSATPLSNLFSNLDKKFNETHGTVNNNSSKTGSTIGAGNDMGTPKATPLDKLSSDLDKKFNKTGIKPGFTINGKTIPPPYKTVTIDERTIESCPTYRNEMESRTNLTVPERGRYRDDDSSHSSTSCGIDFSVKGLTDEQAKEEARKLSEGGSYCQLEKVEGNKQTDYKFQGGKSYGFQEYAEKKKGVTGSHIHCQKPIKKS